MQNKNHKNGRDDRSGSNDRADKRNTSSNQRSGSGRAKSNTVKKKLFGGDRPDFKGRSEKPGGTYANRAGDESGERKSFRSSGEGFKKPSFSKSRDTNSAPSGRRSSDKKSFGEDRPDFKGKDQRSGFRKGNLPYEKKYSRDKPLRERSSENKEPAKKSADDGLIRLNRYISNAGICSRRKADELIEAGVISVNGEAVSELGFKVDPAKDVIRYNGETLKREKLTYVLLNKPKDYITTTDDPHERRTVMQLVDKASKERIYPVGRLDRNTTGLLLMTNDGDLADKLSHPRNNIVKIYQAELNRNLTQGDLNKIAFGLELEDGLIKPDQVTYVAGGSKREIGIQIHSGKNRIVRRIFEHLGYEVVKLDRVIYGNLSKKDLPRGRWRYLEEKEIIQLKHLI